MKYEITYSFTGLFTVKVDAEDRQKALEIAAKIFRDERFGELYFVDGEVDTIDTAY